MDNQKHELTSAENSSLWSTYQDATLTICGVKYFLGHELLEHTLVLAKKCKVKIIQIFDTEAYPISSNPRRDLDVHYTRLLAEIGTYSDDKAEIFINNGWMEQPPMAVYRKNLAK